MSSKTKSKKFIYKEGITKKHEVLKEAMKYLDVKNHSHPPDKYEFICNCINRVVNNDPINFIDSSGLISVIENRLGVYDTFNSYLRHVHNIHPEVQNQYDGRKLQYTRRVWMQSMYEEFLAKDE